MVFRNVFLCYHFIFLNFTINNCFAFQNVRFQSHHHIIHTRSTSADNMITSSSSSLMSSITDPIFNVLSDSSDAILTSTVFTDPVIGSSLLSDIAHLILDFATFYVNTNDTMLLQLLTIIGRILTIVSDYLPDHKIAPDELLFQIFMLGWSLKIWADNLHSMIQATYHPVSFRERRLYRIVFLPAGMTWYQYRALMSKKTALIEWIHLKPGDIIPQDNREDCIYLLYRGDIVQILDDDSPNSLNKRRRRQQQQQDEKEQLLHFAHDKHYHTNHSNTPIIYERPLTMKLMERRESTHYNRTRNYRYDKMNKANVLKQTDGNSKVDDSPSSFSETKTTKSTSMMEAGKRGASLLRIDMDKLFHLLEYDSHLALSFQKILLYESLRNRMD